jgi:hypothetical protein
MKLAQDQRKLHDKAFPACEYVFPNAEGEKIILGLQEGLLRCAIALHRFDLDPYR